MPIEMTSHTITEKLYHQLGQRVAELQEQGVQPALAVVLVGHDPKSELYVSSIKQRRAQELGIDFTIHRLDANASEDSIIETIERLNQEAQVTGIIVQLPLPDAIDTDRVLAAVAAEKDVDGLRPGSQFMPPTVSAILGLLEAYDIVLTDKKISIIGQGRLVGAPLLREMKQLKLDVNACDESVEDLSTCTLDADIVISATGEPNLIRPSMVKEKAVVIDVDCDVLYDEVAEKVAYITPQKGGVGPLTVAYLLANVVEAAEKQHPQGE